MLNYKVFQIENMHSKINKFFNEALLPEKYHN
jgi:hypothetical protein